MAVAKKDGKKKKDTETPVSAETVVLNGHEVDEMPDVSAIVGAAIDPGPPDEPASSPSPLLPPPGPSRPPSAAPATRASASPGWSTDDLSDAVLVPLQVARSVLPSSRTPVVLGVAALGLLGLLDWPAALGIGLGWEALRRWGPDAAAGNTGRER